MATTDILEQLLQEEDDDTDDNHLLPEDALRRRETQPLTSNVWNADIDPFALLNSRVIDVFSSQQPSNAVAERVTWQKQQQQCKSPSFDESRMGADEIYRIKNRDRMRSARRRQRECIKQMRETLELLETHYQQLSDEAQRRKTGNVGSKQSTVKNVKNLEAKYISLADLSHQLQEEKFQLERLMTEKEIFYLRIKREMADHDEILRLPPPDPMLTAARNKDSAFYSDFEFTLLTQAEADEHIRRCYHKIRDLEARAEPLSARSVGRSKVAIDETVGDGDSDPLPRSATFGWTVFSQSANTNDFFVCCSKFFAGITPYDAMQRLWSRDSCPRVKFLSSRHVLRYETLQVINESVYVVGIDLAHPVKENQVLRSRDLRFRLATETGYVMGRCSMNPQSREVNAYAQEQYSFEYLDSIFWLEFTAQNDETTGAEGCLLKFYVHGGYVSNWDMYVRLINVLSIAFLWENSILPSPWKLLPS